MTGVLRDLRAALGGDAVLGPDEIAGRQRSFWDSRPLEGAALVRARTVEEVATTLRLCNAIRQPVVPLGGLTNLPGCADSGPTDVLLSLERMSRVEAIDVTDRVVRVEAGAVLQAVQDRVGRVGLMTPVDFGARGSATIGGMVATNAGGNRVLRYGMTREMVLGLEAVLADGTVVSSMLPYLKNNTGYDLKQLFIGSEGTLGVVTRAVLRLHPLPASRQTAMLAVDDLSTLPALLARVRDGLGRRLSAFEALWGSLYELNAGPLGSARPIFGDSHAGYVIVEADGTDPAADDRQFEAALSGVLDEGLIADAVIAASEAERAALWEIREGTEAEARMYAQTENYDVSLPIGATVEYAEGVRATLAERLPGTDVHPFGHLGDGNLHLLVGHREPCERSIVDEVVYSGLVPHAGSISAEHGIGIEKKPYLALCRTAAEIELMRALKRTLDPAAILNPGKIFD